MRYGIAGILLACSLAAAETVVPVYEEPFHRLVADSTDFKILNILIPPGGTTLYHRHAEPTFYVVLNRTVVRSQLLGGEWSAPIPATELPGSVSHNDESREKPFEHRVNNMGDEGFHLMLITNDRRARHAPDLDVMASMPGEAGIESEYFTQSRIELGPGKQLSWSGVKHPVVFVLATNTHVLIRGNTENSFARGMLTAGDFQSINGDTGLQFENRSDEPAIIIALAVR
ncbi:MAG: hypothetical protein OEM63_10305 [Gammaproteobacteria bacterium]|nr:hypothetical protein [Gammaproteobacteria bacterium]